MANIIPLKESSGAQFYPQTHEKAVVDSNGVTLASKLANISAPSYVVAWDGNSTPVVANIPAGVTFTYSGNTYTGTLAASSSTVNKTYLVGDNNGNFDEYITQVSGSTYSWVHLGNTSIDLSDYATKEELNQLEQEVDGSLIKRITWSAGYVNSLGTINNSSVSQFSQPILLKQGEKVTIGTQNTNIGIICSTTADSVSVGSTVTIIQKTSSVNRFETYEYTATEDIKIVLCVTASNYTLSFFDTNNLASRVSKLEDSDERPTADSEKLVKSGGVEATLFHHFASKELVAQSAQQRVMLRTFDYGDRIAIRIKSNTATFQTDAHISVAIYNNSTTLYRSLSSKWEAIKVSAGNSITGIYIYTTGEVTVAGVVDIEVIFGDAFRSQILDNAPTEGSDNGITSGAVYAALESIGEDSISTMVNNLPSYYKEGDYLNNKINVLSKYIEDTCLKGDSFYFITDTHWELNQKHSPALIKELEKHLNIRKIMHGGDVYDVVPNHYNALECTNAFRMSIGNDKFYECDGNHEYINYDSYGRAFSKYRTHLEDAVYGGNDKTYYYVDNTIKKIRYVFLLCFGERNSETGSYTYGFEDQGQLAWFSNIALNVEAGWDILIFTHYAASDSASDRNSLKVISGFSNISDIINNYIGDGRILAIITGHTHWDITLFYTVNVPIIVSTCDHNHNFEYPGGYHDFDNIDDPREAGTISEQAFDVVVYDRDRALLHFVRIGSGADNKLNLSVNNSQVDCRSIYCEPWHIGGSAELPTYLSESLIWSSTDSNVVSINNGVATAVGSGIARIDVTDGSEKQSFFIKVTS